MGQDGHPGPHPTERGTNERGRDEFEAEHVHGDAVRVLGEQMHEKDGIETRRGRRGFVVHSMHNHTQTFQGSVLPRPRAEELLAQRR